VSLVERVRVNLRDVHHFGPTVLGRHLARLKADRIAIVHVPDVGDVQIRAGESDIATLRQVFVGREYDLNWPPRLRDRIRARYEAILAEGGKPIIVDAGANIGAASLWFSAEFPEARIVAIEPDPENAEVLRRNLAARPHHVVMEAAIGGELGHVSLRDEGYSWAIRTERAQAGIPIITMADAFAASSGDTPFVVKIDIEGFEKDLFATNVEWIESCYVVTIEPHDWMLPGEHTSGTFQAALAAHPFELYIRGENLIYVRV
jgi:FkbM family methyltransferase